MSGPIGSSIDPALFVSCLTNETLHLVLLPTEACNFRCVYCYEDFKYKRMEPWVVRGVKELIRRRSPTLSNLTISWFGGEPLLARGVIEDVMEHVCEISQMHPGIRVDSDATTNGYLLTRTVADRLLDLGVSRYQISFDGPRDWHDRKRVLAGGKGTFDRIWGNLLALRELDRDFTITIRVHVDRTNVEAIPEFIDGCAAEFGGDSRYEMFIRGLARLGGPNDADLPVFEKDVGEVVYEGLRAYARSRGLRTMMARSTESVCYAARANSFVVRANGRLNKCTVSLEHPNNQVGRIREDGTVEIDTPKMMQWMRGLRTGRTEELHCPMKGYAEPGSIGGERAIPLAVSVASATSATG